MSEGNLPIYADYVTTASNGTLLKEIKFASSLIEESKEYTVAFYSDALDDAIVNTFSIYTEDDYVDTITNKSKQDIAVAPYARIVRDSGVAQSAGVSTGAIVYENITLKLLRFVFTGHSLQLTDQFLRFSCSDKF